MWSSGQDARLTIRGTVSGVGSNPGSVQSLSIPVFSGSGKLLDLHYEKSCSQ